MHTPLTGSVGWLESHMDVQELLYASEGSLQRGMTARAVDEAQHALELSRGDLALEVRSLHALGAALWARGEIDHAATVLGAAHTAGEPPSSLDDLAQGSSGWTAGTVMSVEEVITWFRTARDRRGRPTSGWQSLTPSEVQVVGLALEGLTNPLIASRLFISTNTVKTHLQRSYRKLGVTSRAELRQVGRGPR